MRWLRLLTACIALGLAGLPAGAVLADTATSTLIAGPPATGDWQVDSQSGPMTKDQIYGSGAAKVQQFVDAYREVWTTPPPRQIMADRLERYSSTLWAAFRFGESHSASLKNKQHTSEDSVPALGPNAYEVRDPVDANGFLSATIVFQQGDYLAVITLYDPTLPLEATLLDQATRQYSLIPEPVAEENAISHGLVTAILVAVGIAGAVAVIVAAIILIVVLRRRRSQPASPQLSPDRRYWWDGKSWQDTAMRMPAGAMISPDGTQWWDGAAWRPRPPA